jgi:hypothetical protein
MTETLQFRHLGFTVVGSVVFVVIPDVDTNVDAARLGACATRSIWR